MRQSKILQYGRADLFRIIGAETTLRSVFDTSKLTFESPGSARGQLFHFWLDNPVNPVTEDFPWNWFGPWVLTG
jgi:hypothetical protein